MSSTLLLTNIYPPSIGGPATFMHHLAHSLAAQGERVTVVCSSEGLVTTVPDSQNSLQVPKVHRYSIERRYRYEAMIRMRIALELARHKKILINGLENYAAPIARLLGRPYALKIVGDVVWERARNLGFTSLDIDAFQPVAKINNRFSSGRAAQQAALIQAQIIITPSEYLKHLIIGWGVNADRIQVIPNSYSPEISTQNASIRKQPFALARGSAPFQLLFVGRLTNWKGIETILLALRELPNTKLTICGDGPQMPSALSLAKQLHVLERCTFMGRVEHETAIELMSSSDALVLPSLYEGLSHTLLDALASGLPVIASKCGGNTELIRNDVEGLLITPESPQEIIAAVGVLFDPQKWMKLSAGACIRSAPFSQLQVTRMYSEALSNLVL